MIVDTSTEISFRTNSALKQVYLDDNLYKSLPIHQVGHRKQEVSRIHAALKSSSNMPQDITSYNNLTVLNS